MTQTYSVFNALKESFMPPAMGVMMTLSALKIRMESDDFSNAANWPALAIATSVGAVCGVIGLKKSLPGTFSGAAMGILALRMAVMLPHQPEPSVLDKLPTIEQRVNLDAQRRVAPPDSEFILSR